MKEYLISVTAAAVICGCVMSLLGSKGTIGAVGKLLCGIFLAVTVIRPVLEVELTEFEILSDQINQSSYIAVETGTRMVQAAMSDGIKTRMEAYILDKATALGADLEVDVILSEDAIPVPKEIQLRGTVSPYIKKLLAAWLETDLGINGEGQIWIG